MPCIRYATTQLRADSMRVVDQANAIIAEYARQGYDLTLRQLYYQFVSRDLLPNTPQQYKRLGGIINDARLCGLIDWDRIVDRTRELHDLPNWVNPQSIVNACARQFRHDLWADQPCRVEVWIEKEALAGVFERVCDELRVPFLSCRGYTSQSEMWGSAQRLLRVRKAGQEPIILHFGDHDPSGLDMTRDIKDRLRLFTGQPIRLQRMALNMDQIETYGPPPNPAKTTDARYADYAAEYGEESWELDALEPDLLAGLVRDFVEEVRDADLWRQAEEGEAEARRLLTAVSSNWRTLTETHVSGGRRRAGAGRRGGQTPGIGRST